jgi:hypothetical protein
MAINLTYLWYRDISTLGIPDIFCIVYCYRLCNLAYHTACLTTLIQWIMLFILIRIINFASISFISGWPGSNDTCRLENCNLTLVLINGSFQILTHIKWANDLIVKFLFSFCRNSCIFIIFLHFSLFVLENSKTWNISWRYCCIDLKIDIQLK